MKPLVIIGDSLLDVDVEGSATRLSPEAPVPVVDAERLVQRPGGAGLAALLAARTETGVVLITGIVDDDAGAQLRGLLATAGVRVLPLPMTGSTVTKTRIRARGHSICRLDRGDAAPVSAPLVGQVLNALADARAICVADYGGGITSLPEIRQALGRLTSRIPVVWDPHPRGAQPVPGCTLVTPNQQEAQHLCPDRRHRDVGETLRRRWDAAAVCITRGSRGAHVYGLYEGVRHVGVPASAAAGAAPADVCGAGDRFAVAAASALGSGADPEAAVVAAVTDAARFVTTGGAAAVSTPVLGTGALSAPIRGHDPVDVDVDALAARLRRDGRTVVATGGCFDLLHTGHIRLLRQARELGDALIVLVNSDASVRALKGAGRPVMRDADRARILGALACVDAVAIFDGSTPERSLETLRPDIWVKGGDYAADDLPEAEMVRQHGGEVVILPTVAGYSSSRLIAAAGSGPPQTER